MRWDAGYLIAQCSLGVPKVVVLLHPEPEIRAVAAELADPERHFGSDPRLLSEDAVQGLARNAELLRNGRDRHLECRHGDFPSKAPGWLGARSGCRSVLRAMMS